MAQPFFTRQLHKIISFYNYQSMYTILKNAEILKNKQKHIYILQTVIHLWVTIFALLKGFLMSSASYCHRPKEEMAVPRDLHLYVMYTQSCYNIP